MLRKLVFAVALAVCLIGVGALLAGHRGAWPAALWGGFIAAAVVLERWRYRRSDVPADGDWQPTEERFVDPESGQAMQVFYNPRTGERRYGSTGGG
jgi:hypothetical protein